MRCRCGHPKVSHQHYRPGTDCSACPCRRYRWKLWKRQPVSDENHPAGLEGAS